MLTRKYHLLTFLPIIWLLAIVGDAPAAGPASTVSRTKSATALVDVNSRQFGTAFCIDSWGVFVTNAHVVKVAIATGAKVRLVLQPGEKSQKIVTASVLRADEKQDLALLLVERSESQAAADYPRLDLGTTDGLFETSSVTAYGFPFGRLLAEGGTPARPPAQSDDYPSITVSTGHVTSLRKLRGDLQHIQLDASLNPGNSGGPVVDDAGKVIGIVQAGIYGSGVNLAIPVEKIFPLFEPPLVICPQVTVPSARRAEPVEVPFHVIRAPNDRSPMKVVFACQHGNDPEQVAELHSDDANYVGKVAPAAAAEKAARVRITVEGADGSLSGVTSDASFQCGERRLKLSEVRRLVLGSTPKVMLASGGVLAGPITSPFTVDLDLGGQLKVHADLLKAPGFRVAVLEDDDRATTYRISVFRDSRATARAEGEIVVKGAAEQPAPTVERPASAPPSSFLPAAPPLRPAAPGAVASTVPSVAAGQPAAAKTEIRLPAAADDVVVARGGRYLLLTLKRLRQLAVFDTGAGKIVRFIPLPEPDALVAAGLNTMFVALPSQKVIQRWNLGSFERELSVVIPAEGTPRAIAMGYDSDGPLLLETLSQARYHLVVLETRNLQPLAAQDKTQLPDAGVEASVRAAPDGSAFGYWQNDQPADGIGMLVVESNSVRRVQHDRIGASFAIPAAAAQYLFAGNGGLLDNRFRTLIPADNNGLAGGQYFFPAIGGGYYIVASAAPRQGEPVGHFMLTLYHLGSNQPLAPLPATEELLTSPPNVFMRGNEFPAFKHVFYLPEKNLLITLPQGSDQLILRRFDLIAALEQYGVDYLFVESTPLVTATPGSDYGYQLVVRSKRGGVTYRLENGPAGMAVSKTGQITWRVPGKPADAQVIVSVRDLSGREIFHSFTITPREN